MHEEQDPEFRDPSLIHADASARHLVPPMGGDIFSSRLCQALHDVPVPGGLVDRILARLADASSNVPATDYTVPLVAPSGLAESENASRIADCAAPAPVEDRPVSGRFRRRALLIGVLSTAAALGLAWLGYEYTRPIWAAPALLEQIVLFHGPQSAQLVPLSAEPLPFSSILIRPRGTAGQRLGGLPGLHGTAYELRYKKTRATLYVVNVRMQSPLPTAPPLQPDLASGGLAAAAWQEGKLTYILVVEGGLRQYQQCIPQQGIAVAVSIDSGDSLPPAEEPS